MSVTSTPLCLDLAVSDLSESFSTALITPETLFGSLSFIHVKVLQFSVVVPRKDLAFGYLYFDGNSQMFHF